MKTLFFILLFAFIPLSKADISKGDITKTEKPNQKIRIISLAPHLTEMLYSAGAGDLIVGAVNYSDHPAKAKKLPLVGSYNEINIEQIIELNPSLIIAWKYGNTPQDILRLKKLGYNVWQTEVLKLTDIPLQIQQIGEKTNHQATANKVAQQLQEILKNTKKHYKTINKSQIFYQVWDKPLYTIGKNQFITQAIELCGANNIFGKINQLAPQISSEAVIKQNPDIIILGGTTERQKIWQQHWQQYPTISAVKNDQIIKVNNSVYQRPTERFIKAIPRLCERIHNNN